MTNKFTRRWFFVAVILAVVLCLISAFSVSYAKWQAPEQEDMPCSLGIGVWGSLEYSLVTKNGTTTLTESNGTYTATFKAKPDDTVELKLGAGTVTYPVTAGDNLVRLDGNSYKVLKAPIYDNMTTVKELSYTITVSGQTVSFTVDMGELGGNVFNPGEIADILGNESGLVTSNGQVVKFDGNSCEVTLAPGESFTLYIDGKLVSTDTFGGTWGGATITKPDNIDVSSSSFTDNEGGTYTITYEESGLFLKRFDINIQEKP